MDDGQKSSSGDKKRKHGRKDRKKKRKNRNTAAKTGMDRIEHEIIDADDRQYWEPYQDDLCQTLRKIIDASDGNGGELTFEVLMRINDEHTWDVDIKMNRCVPRSDNDPYWPSDPCPCHNDPCPCHNDPCPCCGHSASFQKAYNTVARDRARCKALRGAGL